MTETSPKEYLPDSVKFLIAIWDKILPCHLIWGGIIMILLGALVLSFGILWQHKLSSQKLDSIEKAALKKPWKNSLEDLFVKSFPHLLNSEQKFQIKIQKPPSLDKLIEFRFRLHYDFDSHSDFVSLFVPTFDDARLMDMTPGILAHLVDQIKPYRDQMRTAVGVGSNSPGTAYIEGKDLAFSGRVFIYTMNNLDPIQIGELIKLYKEKQMFLEIRGNDYWWIRKDE